MPPLELSLPPARLLEEGLHPPLNIVPPLHVVLLPSSEGPPPYVALLEVPLGLFIFQEAHD